MAIVYGAPYRPPAAPADPWVGVGLSWTGWDGSEWTLSDPDAGQFLMRGVRGLHLPPFERHAGSSPAIAGSRHRGSSTKDREAFWPLYLYHDAGSREFLERDRAFWRTLHPDKLGTWTAALPDGTKRTLQLRLAGADDGFDLDPLRFGWARYAITLLAEQPYWEGTPIRRKWKESAQRAFLPPVANAGYWVSSGSTLSTATLTNPGDVDAHVIWTVTGPFTSVTVGVGGDTVVAPITAADGQTLVIDSDPQVQAAFLDGVDVTDQLTTAEFGVLPPGEDVALSLAMTGTGYVEAAFTPRYFRAW